MGVADDLRAARALIDTPEKWGTERDRPDRLCSCDALWQVTGASRPDDYNAAYDALMEAAREYGAHTTLLSNVNDRIGHAGVMALFDRAIAAATPPTTA